ILGPAVLRLQPERIGVDNAGLSWMLAMCGGSSALASPIPTYGYLAILVLALVRGDGAVRVGSNQGQGEPGEARGSLRDGAASLYRSTTRHCGIPFPQFNR